MASKEEKRSEILRAAAKIFSEMGLDRAKIEDIAKEAGIGKGTVYEYFTSKNELFQEMLRSSVVNYRNNLRAAITNGDTIREKLMNCSEYHAQFIKEHIDILRSAAQLNFLSKELREWMMEERKNILQVILEMVKEGISKGELREDLDPELATFCIIGTISEHYAQRAFFEEKAAKDINHGPIIDLMMQGLA